MSESGKVFIRQCGPLAAQDTPVPEKWCRSVITLTELQRKKLVDFLSFGDA